MHPDITKELAKKKITNGITARLKNMNSATSAEDRSKALSDIQSYIKNNAIPFIENKNKGLFSRENKSLKNAVAFAKNLHSLINPLINDLDKINLNQENISNLETILQTLK